MTDLEAINVIKQYAARLVKFKEDSDTQPHHPGCLHYGFVMPGGFGDADQFYAAMRVLRGTRMRCVTCGHDVVDHGVSDIHGINPGETICKDGHCGCHGFRPRSEPDSCPVCRGTGGRKSIKACDYCNGSGDERI